MHEPFRRLIEQRQLFALKYHGFWCCMDTFKDKQRLEDMVARRQTPWEVWNDPALAENGNVDLDASLDLLRTHPR